MPPLLMSEAETVRRRQCLQAGMLTIPAVVLAAWLADRITRVWPDLPPAATLVLGVVPLHLAGAGVALAFLLQSWPPGERLRLLHLRLPSTGGVTALWRLVAETLLWTFPLTVFLTAVTVLVLRAAGVNIGGSPVLQLVQAVDSPGGWLVTVLLLVGLAPLAEEFLFRYLLYDALALLNPHLAAAAAAACFAAIHGIPEQVPALFALGLVCQRLRARADTLWAAILLHAAYNGVSLMLILLLLRARGHLP